MLPGEAEHDVAGGDRLVVTARVSFECRALTVPEEAGRLQQDSGRRVAQVDRRDPASAGAGTELRHEPGDPAVDQHGAQD